MKPKHDFNTLAKSIVDQATGSSDGKSLPPIEPTTISQVMREMGRKGGLKGGKARAASMTSEKRIAIAKMAAAKRWNKK